MILEVYKAFERELCAFRMREWTMLAWLEPVKPVEVALPTSLAKFQIDQHSCKAISLLWIYNDDVVLQNVSVQTVPMDV